MRSTYANRGQTLESFVNFANKRYRQEELAHVEKQHTAFIPIRNGYGKIISAKVDQKATFDFMGRFKGYPLAVEAKNTNQDTIRWDAVQPNQAKDLDDFTRERGTIGLIVISFNLESFYAIPWAFWSEAYRTRVLENNKEKPLHLTYHGQTWDVPKKFSIREEELLPEWKISGRDHRYGLHYLENAENYIK